MQRILILMSDTGGGHRSAAQAIADSFAREMPGKYDVILEDAFKRGFPWPICLAPVLYLPTITYAKPLYALSFYVTDARVIRRLLIHLLYLFAARGLRRLFTRTQPDLVVSVHPLFTTIVGRVLRGLGSHVPFSIVVTDLFDTHSTWFDPNADLCVVPTEGAHARARQFGMPDEKLRVVGQPVSLKFIATPKNKRELRVELGLYPNKATVLLVGGGEGMGPLHKIARAIARTQLPAQLVVIAGRNQALCEKLQSTAWEIPVSIQGFVTNMPDWMHASDVIITKAGPGTISEALACGLPILLSGFLPGQERGNVTFVEQSGVGVLREKPEELACTLREWLMPGNDTLVRLAARARELARPHAALEIATLLDETLTARESQV